MEEIRCFQHCTNQFNILCFSIPEICPICQQNILQTGMRIPPYLIPSPFTNAESTSCSLLIKPTVGNFVTDFTKESNLHVGLTDMNGCVHEFDENGITVGSCEWRTCIKVTLLHDDDPLKSEWNKSLQKFKDGRLWKKELYDENSHNCFDFVVSFLRFMGLDRMYPSLIDRRLFCKDMIVPKTGKAGKYIGLYREILQNGSVVKAS